MLLLMSWQILLAFPFLLKNPWGYLSRAFEFSRQFLFKWTVNWRFMGEERFLSKEFSYALLAGHISLVAVFISTRWVRLPFVDILEQLVSPPPVAEQAKLARKTNPNFILTAILTSVLIGCQFARSLHYQFYAYVAWTTPFLLWRSGMHPIAIYAIWAAQEWAWNVYPSTDTSSIQVIICIKLAVLNIWMGTVKPEDAPAAEKGKSKQAE